MQYERQTVLITGASSGLGAEFARQLAAKGSNLVLVARRTKRLEQLASVLSDNGVSVTTIAMDLSHEGVGMRLRDELAARGVAVTSVINNAGFGNHGKFHEKPIDSFTDEIALNVRALVEISHAFMPMLREHGNGFLINVASVVAYQAIPNMAVYGASKAFVLSFTEALWHETRNTGVRVLALSPGATETEFFDVAGQGASGGFRRMRADIVIQKALTTLDRRNPPPSVIAGGVNYFSANLNRVLPRRLAILAAGWLMSRG